MTEAVNPNVNVQEESTSESKIGEVTSFDQLDRITDEQLRINKVSGRKKKEPEEQAEESQEEEKAEVPQDNLPKQSTTEEDSEIVPTLGINPENLKPLKLTHGEETYEVFPSANVPMKIDGEKASVPLQELMQNYSGKVAWDKRFNELNQEKQSFKTELRKFQEEKSFVDERINHFYDLSKDDPIKAFEVLCDMSGKDSLEFQKNFRDNLVKRYEEYYNMDDLSRREFDLSERERYLEGKKEAESTKGERERAIKAEQERIQGTLETFNIDQDRYFDVRDELVKSAPDATIEPMHVVRYERALAAQELVREVRPDKAEDTALLGELAAVMVQNPSFTQDDLREILKEIWKDVPTDTSKTLSKKVLKTQTQAKAGQGSKASQQVAWNFDQV